MALIPMFPVCSFLHSSSITGHCAGTVRGPKASWIHEDKGVETLHILHAHLLTSSFYLVIVDA